jgi:hypothetical protein
MNHGELFAEIMTRAVMREEEEIKGLLPPYEKTVTGTTWEHLICTTHHYYESWLWVAFFKEALRDNRSPHLKWEKGKTDLCVFGKDGKTIEATFELKPYYPVNKQHSKIIEDFEKQYKKAQQNRTCEHYVVVIPWGSLEAIDLWVKNLRVKVEEFCPGIKLGECPSTEAIKLNHESYGYAVVKVFAVNAS